MTHPLQAKDDQWRDRRENGSVPVFDPGLSPPGTDEEAGGAPAAMPSDSARSREPMPATPRSSDGGGVRLPPRVWYVVAAGIVVILLVVGWLSFAA